MATHKMGTIREIDVHELWDHEAHDFTPWLAEHIGLLGKALGMDLDPESPEIEVQVGAFSLDILARDGGRSPVVIENQLEWTDHSHMGQLLTYAAGREASVVVWIATHFRDEHRAAIDWLNRMTLADVKFFGVEVRAITIEQGEDKEASLPAPEFRPVAFPNDWTKGNVGKRGSSGPPAHTPWLDFFQPLVDRLRESGFTAMKRAKKDKIQRFEDECVKNTYYTAWFGFKYAIVGVTMFNKDLYAKLEERESLIAAEIAKATVSDEIRGKLCWRNPKSFQFSEIQYRINGRISDPPERLEEIRDWMFDSLPKFREILNSHIKGIVRELETEATASSAD